MPYANSTIPTETRMIWVSVEGSVTDHEADMLMDKIADAVGTDYQVVVTTDDIETLSRSDVAHFMGQMIAAMGLDVDITMPEDE